MTTLKSTAKICLITHQGIARHLQSVLHKEDGVYAAELHKVRTSGSIGTANFSELEEQGKLVVLCTADDAEKIYALAYEKLELTDPARNVYKQVSMFFKDTKWEAESKSRLANLPPAGTDDGDESAP